MIDAKAMDTFDRHQRTIFMVFRENRIAEHVVPELLQEVRVRVLLAFRLSSRLQKYGAPAKFFERVSRNVCMDYFRERTPLHVGYPDTLQDKEYGPDVLLDRKMRKAWLMGAGRKLGTQDKQVLSCALKDMTAKQTAYIMGISIINAKVLKHRLIHQLRKILLG